MNTVGVPAGAQRETATARHEGERERVLVLGRASTAVRLARSVRAAGLSPVGVVAPADRGARWCVALDAWAPVSAYDAVEEVVAAAQTLGARTLHPGVGFAAESPALARTVEEAGLIWVGPQADALERLTDKLALARLARDLGIPVPAAYGPLGKAEDLTEAARALKGPLIVKSVHGGGGRGVISLPAWDEGAWDADQLMEFYAGMGPLLVQAAVPQARHIEVQALGDGSGQILTAGTRECSLQRRHQKVLEEAPAPFLSLDLVAQLEEWTRLLLGHLRYRGVGTCEFLLGPGGEAVLLEVNARLQVEHAVTEQVTGLDLVRAGLALAEGASLEEMLRAQQLPLCPVEDPESSLVAASADARYTEAESAPQVPAGSSTRMGAGYCLPVSGHSAESRLYAEDPGSLLPASGTLLRANLPVSLPAQREATAAGRPAPVTLRTERGLGGGDRLTTAYNEPLALLSVHAATRIEALGALDEALAEVEVRGLPTLAPLLRDILAHPDMRATRPETYRITTQWLESVLRPHAVGTESAALPRLPETASHHASGSPAHTPAAAALREPEPLRAPMSGVLLSIPQPGAVRAGQQVAVLEAMKMRLPLAAPAQGSLRVAGEALTVGMSVRAGQILAWIDPIPAQDAAVGSSLIPSMSSAQPSSSRPTGPLQPAPSRPSRPSARERLEALIDPGTARDLTDEDAVLTAWGRIEGREVALWIQDPTRLGGTIGVAGARRVAALVEEAASQHRPVVSILDGGGARIQEGTDALGGVGLILAATTRARGRAPMVSVVAGPAAGGAAYAPALTDVLVMVEGAGELFLTGPAVLASSTGERVDAEHLGGAQTHATLAGTAHRTVPTEQQAWAEVRTLLRYLPVGAGPLLPFLPSQPTTIASGTAQPSSGVGPAEPGQHATEVRHGDETCGGVVPADPSEPYDVRALLHQLADRGEVVELRQAWAPNAVTALARVGGVPVGIVATQPAAMAGSIDPLAADKIAEHVELCARLHLPLHTVVDTPGFLPGEDSESAGVVRRGARVVAAYAGYEAAAGYEGALITLITRRAFGGAYVALGSRALAGAHTLAWPQARIGVMDARSAAAIIGRRALAQVRAAGGDVEAERARQVASAEAAQSAEVAHAGGWIDALVEPGQTRAHLIERLEALTRPDTPGPRLAPLGQVRRPGDGWVECSCGSRHWGLCGAAGVLVWRYVLPAQCGTAPERAGAQAAATAQQDAGTSTRGVASGTFSLTAGVEGGTAPRLEVLLQHRAFWTHQGGTWGVPGGAVAQGESAEEGALREWEEETGIPAATVKLGAAHVQDHGDWSYSTYVAQAPSVHEPGAGPDPARAWDRPLPWDGESTEFVWVELSTREGRWLPPTAPAVNSDAVASPSALLPALARVWDELAALLPAPSTPIASTGRVSGGATETSPPPDLPGE